VYLSEAKHASLPFTGTGDRFIPDAGWMRIKDEAHLMITYTVYTENE
jgi:hypothetical protein